jgi:hypothetical protein
VLTAWCGSLWRTDLAALLQSMKQNRKHA